MRLNDLINQEVGPYRIEALLGRGGMAAVYRAFDTRLQRHVALKLLYPQYLADPDIVQRFHREAVTAAQLDHPHIAPIFDVGESDGLHYLAMKLLPGPSLAELLQREGRFSLSRTVTLLQELAAALDEAHQHGIVHRDIKPGNVLFDAKGRAVLTDFGIAKSLDAPALTETSVIVGTPDYIAPEQIDSRLAPNGKLDHRADLYSLGALLYRTLTGRRPFDGSSQMVLLAHLRDEAPPPSTVEPTLPPAVDGVVAKAMAKRPEERYASASELAAALAACLGEQTEVGVIVPPAARQQPAVPATQGEPFAASAAPTAVPDVASGSRLGRTMFLSAIIVIPLLLLGFLVQRSWPTAKSAWADPVTGLSSSIEASPPATTNRTTTTTLTETVEPSAISPTVQASTPTEAQIAAVPNAAPSPTQQPATAPRPAAQPPAARPTNSVAEARPSVRPTERPSPTSTATATSPQCEVALAGGFGALWRAQASVREALGCPLEAERAGYSVEQLFEGGLMYYRDDTEQFWVFSNGAATWRLYVDVYPSDPEPTDEPPPDRIKPVRGFGRLWQKYSAIRETLGWGTTPETGFVGVVQRFERGTMLYTPDVNNHAKRIYVLYNTGTFELFRDTYTGP